MKINNLHITAFGKLADITMDFDSGMNLLYGDNEYGKSTILSFIRAMFYGFSGRSSTRMRENDRKKFTPWSGQPFGGSIEFQHAAGTYLLEKTFGKKRADDRVTLTLLPSGQKTDLAQKEVGEYLFAVSEAEFVNTVFVGQLSSNILGTEKETDDISARLINLADTGSELFSYEEIKTRLISASSKLIALRGSGGLIPALEDGLADLEEKETDLEASQVQTEILRKEINEALEKQKSIRSILHTTETQLAEKRLQSAELTENIRRAEILLQTTLQKIHLDQQRAGEKEVFERTRQDHLLQREELGKQLTEECTRARDEIDRLMIQNGKDRESAAAFLREADSLLNDKESLLRENNALYGNKVHETQLLEEEILAVSSDIKTLIQTREDIRKGRTTIIAYRIPARRYEILFLCAFAVSMIVYYFMRDPLDMTGFIFLVLAAVLQISNVTQRHIVEKKIVEKSLAHEAKLKIYEGASATMYDRQTALADCEKKLEEMQLQKIRIQENEQRDEQFREHVLTLAQQRISDCRNRLAQFGEVPGGQEEDKEFADGPEPYKETADGPEPEGRTAEQQNGSLPEDPAEDVDIKALEIQIRSDEGRLAGLRDEISRMLLQEEKFNTEMTASRVDAARKETTRENLLSQEIDLSWLMEQRSLLTDRLEEAKAYYRALMTAQKVLGEAFSEMESFFAPQVNEKAGEYLAKLTDGVYSSLHVDRSFGIDIATEGAYSFRRADFFSGGTVDQIYFALRLAIADLVQSSEDRMPLLLDDAFVQYDDKRAKAGLILLNELSLHRQIVLFTCHNRMSELYASINRDKGSKSE